MKTHHRIRHVAALAALVSWATPACSPRVPAEPDYLHVIVKRLPQCEYGIGFERPMRVDLLAQDAVVATSYHSGIYTGEESLWVTLHVPHAFPGRYRLRFGACPSMTDDTDASVACEPVEWQGATTAYLVPSGIETPQVVEYYRLRATCLDGRRAH